MRPGMLVTRPVYALEVTTSCQTHAAAGRTEKG